MYFIFQVRPENGHFQVYKVLLVFGFDLFLEARAEINTSLKKYTNIAKLSSLVLKEQEETKTRYFAPKGFLKVDPIGVSFFFRHPKLSNLYFYFFRV